VDIQIARVAKRLEERRVTLELTDEARELIGDLGYDPAYDPAYGARPLKRTIQREVTDRLAKLSLAGELPEGSTALVERDGEQIVVKGVT